VTVSEFLFLALGLVLGVASGAALIEIIRSRPPARREVRLTVAQDAIPRRRATTLADDAFVAVGPEPARGGPADRRGDDDSLPAETRERRTNVLSRGFAATSGPTARPSRNAIGRVVGMPISAGADPILGAIHATARRTGGSDSTDRSGEGAPASASMASSAAVALLDPPPAPEATETAPRTYSGPCADERRVADERCELATRAQAQSVAAADALRQAQRAYDSHTAAAEEAAEAANPLTVRTYKEDAQRAFRAASRDASAPDTVEAR